MTSNDPEIIELASPSRFSGIFPGLAKESGNIAGKASPLLAAGAIRAAQQGAPTWLGGQGQGIAGARRGFRRGVCNYNRI